MFRARYRSFRHQVAYRADRFVRTSGAVQFLILLAFVGSLLLAFSMTVSLVDRTVGMDGLWWSIGRFSDGGTMYSDQGLTLRLLALGVTWTGILMVQLVTGSFTAKLTDRLDRLRSGSGPVVEVGHVLVLGFDAKVPLIARELARSHQQKVVVILADQEVGAIDARIMPARRIPGHRVRFEVRRGDPHDEFSLLRVSVEKASAIVIVPPDELHDSAADRWTFTTLLAVRRVVGTGFQGHIIVELRHAGKEDVLRAAVQPPPSEPNAAPLTLFPIAADDIISRVVAQSVRQTGVYYVLRELLGFRGSELYFEPVPPCLAGRPFSQVHATTTNAIVVGYCPNAGEPIINPADNAILSTSDNLIVLQQEAASFLVADSSTVPKDDGRSQLPETNESPMRVFILGDNRIVPNFLGNLTSCLPLGSHVVVVHERDDPEFVQSSTGCRVQISLTKRSALEAACSPSEDLLRADTVVILGSCLHGPTQADQEALETLVSFRQAQRRAGRFVKKVITVLSHLENATHVVGTPSDFVISSEIIGLLIAQVVNTPRLEAALRKDLLDPEGNDVFVRPRADYGLEASLTFGQVMLRARSRNEIAIGLMDPGVVETTPNLRRLYDGLAEDDETSPVQLVPSSTQAVPLDAMVVVLGRPLPAGTCALSGGSLSESQDGSDGPET